MRELRLPAEAICSVWFDGGKTEGEHLWGDLATLRDLPPRSVRVQLEVIERDPVASWLLEKTVDLASAEEVTFELPRRGRVLVLPVRRAQVVVEGLGRAECVSLNDAFCTTPPIPAGRVSVDLQRGGLRFPFDVPAGEGRVLVPVPEVLP